MYIKEKKVHVNMPLGFHVWYIKYVQTCFPKLCFETLGFQMVPGVHEGIVPTPGAPLKKHQLVYGGFRKCWYPTTISLVFLRKNDQHLGGEMGVPPFKETPIWYMCIHQYNKIILCSDRLFWFSSWWLNQPI